MKILFCNYEYPPLGGGGGVINALLAEELATRHEVTVLTSQGFGLPPEGIENGVRVLRVPVFFRTQQAAASFPSMFAYMVLGVRQGKALLRKEGFDVINTHFVLPSGPVGDALARCTQIPNVLSVHGGDLYDPSKWTSPHRHALLRSWVRVLLKRADCVVGQSRNTLHNVRQFFVPELEGKRIPLGIRRPPQDTATRADYGFHADDVLLVTVGRLVQRKAVDQLVCVMPQLAHPRVHLLVVGTGPQEPRLHAQATQLNVLDRIRFLGHLDEAEKFRVLRMSDIFVSTSQHEGFGLVFLEAMACGLPVVCYDHGGQTDFLESERTGFVVPLNDIEAYRHACRSLTASRALRQRASMENFNRVERYYIDHCAQEYEKVFEMTLAARWQELSPHQRGRDLIQERSRDR